MSRQIDAPIVRTDLTPQTTWFQSLGLAALIAAAISAGYWNSLGAPFVFDDRPAIVDNPTIRQLWGSWQTPQNGSSAVGRPLVNMSFAANYALSGLAVGSYHFLNLVLHILTALTLWGILRQTVRRTTRQETQILPLTATLWWALHPLLTESVTCVVQRSEILGGLFYLLTLYAFIRSTESGTQIRFWRTIAVASAFLGVFTKEINVTAPLLALLYDRTFVAGTFRSAWRQRKWLFVALATSWLPLAALVLSSGQRTGTAGFGLGVSAWEYLLTQCRAISLYLKLSFWPHPLVIDYGMPVVRNWGEVAGRGMLLLGLLGATIWALVRRPKLGFLGGAFFVILAPSSSFVPLTTQTIAEHRMYLPLAVVVTAVVFAIRGISPRLLAAGGAFVALALVAATVSRNAVYNDELRLWQQTISDLPENPRNYSNLGNAYVRRREWSRAIQQYEQAVRLRPDFADAHNNLGLALLEIGQLPAGIEHLNTAVQLKPDDADIRYNLGNGYLQANEFRESIRQLSKAVTLRVRFPVAHCKLGMALLEDGRPDEAIEEFAEAANTQPDYVDALAGWGNALLKLGRAEEAAGKYTSALRVTPDVGDLHYNLGNAWLKLGRLREAEKEYRATLAINPMSAAAHHNLGLTLLDMERPAEAAAQFSATIQQLPNSAVAHANLSRALAKLGQTVEAIAEAERSLSLEPDNPELYIMLSRLKTGIK